MRTRALWILPGLAVGALFLWASTRSLDLADGFRLARTANLGFVLLAIASSMAFLVFKAWRWRLIVTPFAPVRARDLFPAVCAGTFMNLTAPHAGEIARALIVSRRESVSTSMLLGSIVIERLLDVGAVLALVGILALRPTGVPAAVASASYAAAGLFLLIWGAAYIGLKWTQPALKFIRVLLQWLPERWVSKLVMHLEAAVTGLNGLRDASLLRQASLLSLLQWACIVVAIYASVRSLGVTAGAVASVAVLLMLVVGLTLPAAPANVGTTQIGFTVGLGAFQIGVPQAFAASVIYTLFVLLPMMIIGIAYLLTMKKSALVVKASRPG